MLKAFANCLKIPELRKKIFFTLAILALCRLAAAVPCPGIDAEALKALFEQMRTNNAGGSGTPGLLDMFNMFTGGALQRFAVAALGIMPYITASIIMQLLTPVFPTLEQWKREGETGFQKINQWTRYLTLIICIVQGYISATVMENPGSLLGVSVTEQVVINPGMQFRIMTVIILTAGTMILMWLGEQITEKGVGQGASLIITVSIIELMPSAVYQMWTMWLNDGQGDTDFSIIHLIILVSLFVIITGAVVWLTLGVRKIPIQYARASGGRTGGQSQSSFFPLKVNYSSVMPIIFAQALLMFPPWMFNLAGRYRWTEWLTGLSPYFQFGTTSYMVIYSALLILFAFFWVANQFNPVQIADDLKRSGAYVPGVRPGKPTADFLDWSMTRVTTAGAIFLTIIALLPMIINVQLDVPFMVASFFGGASLLIIVGVMLDTLRQMESHLVMHGYDTFMERGHLRRRR